MSQFAITGLFILQFSVEDSSDANRVMLYVNIIDILVNLQKLISWKS